MTGYEYRCLNCGWTASPQKWTDTHELCWICGGRIRLVIDKVRGPGDEAPALSNTTHDEAEE